MNFFFLPEKFQFLEMKFSINLNRRVFVMGITPYLFYSKCTVRR